MSEIIDVPYFQNEHPGVYRDGDRVVATDGFVLLVADVAVVPNGESIGPWQDTRRAALKWEPLLEPISRVTEWQSMPELPECDACNGSGTVVEECSRCFGGEHECSCGDTHPCKYCDGTGEESEDCSECKTELFGVRFLRARLIHIKRLPDVEIGACEDVLKSKCIFFRFTGGNGVAMGLQHE